MRNSILANRYLNAFIRNVTPEKVPVALQQVIVMGDTLLNHPSAIKWLASPLIALDKKKSMLMTVAKVVTVDVLVLNLYNVLLEKKRIQHISDIVDQAKEVMPSISGEITVDLKVPFGFEKIELSTIQTMIKSRVEKEVFLTIKEDSELVGGFKATAGFLVFDGTIENNLTQLVTSLN